MAEAWAAIDHEQAGRILDEMDGMLTSRDDPNDRDVAGLALLVRALLSAGQTLRALDVARSMSEPPSPGVPDRSEIRVPRPRNVALAMVAQRFAADGDPDRAERIARGITDPLDKISP